MEKDFSLRKLNTFSFDVKAKYFQELKTPDDVRLLLENDIFRQCFDEDRVLILSGGSNVLFRNDFYDGFVVYPNFKGVETIEDTGNQKIIRCFSGEVWKDFVDLTVAEKLYGLENLSDIPGKVGAAPVQNIGAYGAEVKDVIYQVHTVDLASGEIRVFTNEECKFSYRSSVFKELKVKSRKLKGREANTTFCPLIFAVDFVLKKKDELKLDYGNIRNNLISKNITNPTIQDIADSVKEIRKEKLPEVGVVGSAGSFFQNAIISMDKYLKLKALYPEMPSYPEKDNMVKVPTGWLIDKAGWKGYRENHVGVWDKQALVLVHYGSGKPLEIIELMKKIQHSVKEKFGIEISPEVNII
ncbi:MAG: UDP-N-acetylmuramate dehydrogenase [Bacteroidales bacterium]|nr:UDP-N-acetylmuramate dehydrogenase [Bacteroidales bacterium]